MSDSMCTLDTSKYIEEAYIVETTLEEMRTLLEQIRRNTGMVYFECDNNIGQSDFCYRVVDKNLLIAALDNFRENNAHEQWESIRHFPENADKKDRETLDKLAKQSLIKKDLSAGNKFKLTRPICCKEAVRELLKLGYTGNSGFVFMSQYIDYQVEAATIQNYFRVCKKDIPIQ